MSIHPQPKKRTVLTDELEKELNAKSPEDWTFEARETTCMEDVCDCELVGVCWWSPFSGDEFLLKIWKAEEVRRRKNMADFAKSIIEKLKGLDGWFYPPQMCEDCEKIDCECDDDDEHGY